MAPWGRWLSRWSTQTPVAQAETPGHDDTTSGRMDDQANHDFSMPGAFPVTVEEGPAVTQATRTIGAISISSNDTSESEAETDKEMNAKMDTGFAEPPRQTTEELTSLTHAVRANQMDEVTAAKEEPTYAASPYATTQQQFVELAAKQSEEHIDRSEVQHTSQAENPPYAKAEGSNESENANSTSSVGQSKKRKAKDVAPDIIADQRTKRVNASLEALVDSNAQSSQTAADDIQVAEAPRVQRRQSVEMTDAPVEAPEVLEVQTSVAENASKPARDDRFDIVDHDMTEDQEGSSEHIAQGTNNSDAATGHPPGLARISSILALQSAHREENNDSETTEEIDGFYSGEEDVPRSEIVAGGAMSQSSDSVRKGGSHSPGRRYGDIATRNHEDNSATLLDEPGLKEPFMASAQISAEGTRVADLLERTQPNPRDTTLQGSRSTSSVAVGGGHGLGLPVSTRKDASNGPLMSTKSKTEGNIDADPAKSTHSHQGVPNSGEHPRLSEPFVPRKQQINALAAIMSTARSTTTKQWAQIDQMLPQNSENAPVSEGPAMGSFSRRGVVQKPHRGAESAEGRTAEYPPAEGTNAVEEGQVQISSTQEDENGGRETDSFAVEEGQIQVTPNQQAEGRETDSADNNLQDDATQGTRPTIPQIEDDPKEETTGETKVTTKKAKVAAAGGVQMLHLAAGNDIIEDGAAVSINIVDFPRLGAGQTWELGAKGQATRPFRSANGGISARIPDKNIRYDNRGAVELLVWAYTSRNSTLTRSRLREYNHNFTSKSDLPAKAPNGQPAFILVDEGKSTERRYFLAYAGQIALWGSKGPRDTHFKSETYTNQNDIRKNGTSPLTVIGNVPVGTVSDNQKLTNLPLQLFQPFSLQQNKSMALKHNHNAGRTHTSPAASASASTKTAGKRQSGEATQATTVSEQQSDNGDDNNDEDDTRGVKLEPAEDEELL